MVQTYAAQKAGEKGIERLRLLAASRPKSAPLRHLLGEFYLAGGNRVAARLAFEAAIAASPGYVPAMLALADLEIQIHRLEPARALLGDVLRANPRNVTALLQSASVEQQLGNAPAAIAKYRTVLSVDQENLTAMNNLASSMVFDDADEALRLAQGAAALAPNDARVLNTLGLVYYRKGMYSAAIAPLRAAFDREPTPPHRFHLGLVYLKAGEAELGKKNVQLALQQDPTLTSTERAWY
jgi:tetratricopeptide (TPR) repeat protein